MHSINNDKITFVTLMKRKISSFFVQRLYLLAIEAEKTAYLIKYKHPLYNIYVYPIIMHVYLYV